MVYIIVKKNSTNIKESWEWPEKLRYIERDAWELETVYQVNSNSEPNLN